MQVSPHAFFSLIDVAMQRASKLLSWQKEVQKWSRNQTKCVLHVRIRDAIIFKKAEIYENLS